MMKYIVLTSFLLAVATAKVIQIKSCSGSGNVLPKSVDITPCATFPCTYKKGMKADVKIEFDAQDDQTNLTAAIYGIILGQKIPFPMPNPNGCKNSGINCPVAKGTTYTYQSVFNVEPNYPTIQVIVEWRMDGGSSGGMKNNFCFTFPVKIED